MRTIVMAAGCAFVAISASALAQADAPATPASACYIEVQSLMADPPSGIGEIGAAIRALDTSLRPQVEEVNVLKAQIARLERQVEAAQSAAADRPEEFGIERVALAAPIPDDPGAEEIQRLQTELAVKQDKLKLDYAEQQTALVGPVQERINRAARFFATTNGCAQLKMARAPDLAALTAAGTRNVTTEFVTWYLSDKPG